MSAGILECVHAAVVSSVSVMVNTPGFADGVDRLAALAQPPGVGLHLNLTAGSPVSPVREVPSLVDGRGRFWSLGNLVLRAATGRVVGEDVERETRAQLARLRERWPDVDHLDSHQHVHALPRIWSAVRRAAASAGIPWVRRPFEPARFGRGALKRLAIGTIWLGASLRDPGPGRIRVRGIGLSGGPGFRDDLLAILDGVQDGITEIMVHPGRAEAELASWDPYLQERDAELDVLLSPALRERLARGDIRLIDFRAA